MSDRCEPPEGAEFGSEHFIELDGKEVIAGWSPVDRLWTPARASSFHCDSSYAQKHGLRYLAPVTPPAEVERLRAEVERLRERLGETRMCLICGKVVDASHPRHEDLPECVNPETGMASCTWQTTPDEAWQIWEGRYYEQRATIAWLEGDLARLVEAGEKVDVAHAAMLRAATLGLPDWFERTAALTAAKKEFAAALAAIKERKA